jgi:hypothetical protein
MKEILVLLVLLTGCKKTNEKQCIEAEAILVPVVINDAGIAQCPTCPICAKPRECGRGVRLVTDARIEAESILGVPAVCDESPNNGVTCWDTRGAVVWCPKDLAEPCKSPPRGSVLPEAPAP